MKDYPCMKPLKIYCFHLVCRIETQFAQSPVGQDQQKVSDCLHTDSSLYHSNLSTLCPSCTFNWTLQLGQAIKPMKATL